MDPDVKACLDKIRKATGRPIRIETGHNLPLGQTAAFKMVHSTIVIGLPKGIIAIRGDIGRSVIHEATHGLLLCKYNYKYLTPKATVSYEERYLSASFSSAIEDIVVNKIMFDRGFKPYSDKYIPTIKKETESMKEGIDCYIDYKKVGDIFYSKYKVGRYVFAWGHLQFLEIPRRHKKHLRNFLTRFKKAFPKEYSEARSIIDLIKEHDIFTTDGYHKVINNVLKMWELDKKFKLVSVN